MKLRQFLICLVCCLVSYYSQAQNITRPNIVGPGGVKVNSYTGNMFYQRTDLFFAGRMPLDISFSYNSADRNKNQGFGRGWTFNYGMRILEDGTNVTVVRSDGRKDVYKPSPTNPLTPPAGIFDSLTKGSGGTYLLRSKDGMKYFFNNPSRKYLTRQEDRNGNGLTFDYTDSLLHLITDDAGRTIQLKSSGARIDSIIDANGDPRRTYKYEYDNTGNLVKVTDPMGYTQQYSYVVNGPLNTLTDRNSNVVDVVYNPNFSVKEIISCLTHQTINYNSVSKTTFITELVSGTNQLTSYKFDAGGSLVQKTGSCCGYNVQYEYDKDKNISKMTDANGNVYSYTYDGMGNMLSETDPLSHKTLFTYESVFNLVTKKTDKNGNSVSFSYDNRGNPLQVKEPLNITVTFTYASNGDIASFTDARGNATSFNYDTYGNLVKTSRPLGSTTAYTYDSKSRKLSETDPLNHTSAYAYDALSRLLKVTDALNHASVFSYDHNGNIISFTDANNHSTNNGYDALDRLIKTTNALGKSKTSSYDAKGNLLSLTDENGNTSTYVYDHLNRPVTKTNAAGESMYYSYDGNGNVASMVQPNGNNVALNYDALNRLTKASDIIGTILSNTYDNNGNKLTATDGIGNTTSYAYDVLNRITSVTDPLGHVSINTFDANNNIVANNDRNSHLTTFNYDALNRIIQKIDPINATTNYAYDVVGNNISVTDANTHITAFGYDALNRKVSETFANATVKYFSYDAIGNVISQTDPNGAITNYGYDAVNRLLKRDYSGSNDDVYTYDAAGRMVTANNSDAKISLVYDAASRLTGETLNGRKTGYAFDIPNKTRTINYPGGRIIKELYNVRNNLLKVQEGTASIATFDYDAADRTTKINYPSSGTSTVLSYDAVGRSISMLSNPGGFLNFNYSYDNEGNKLLEKKIHDLSRSEQFTYDNFDRLTQFKKGTIAGAVIATPVTQTQYNMDAVGNRTNINHDGNISTYTSNAVNAYTSIAGANAVTASFDNNGNLTFDGTNNLAYNTNDMLVSVSSGNVAEYKYDALGRRIQKKVGASTINFFYEGMQIIEECDNANVVQASYVNGDNIDQVLTMTRGTNNYFYFYNNLGSVIALVDNVGKISERYDYDAYGNFTIYNTLNQVITASITGNPFYFTGRQFDAETGKYHYRQRNYSGLLGRFLQRDPLGFIDGYNLYTYVNNNPSNLIDPFGLSWWSAAGSFAVGVGVGAVGTWVVGTLIVAAGVVASPVIATAAGVAASAIIAYGVYQTVKTGYEIANGVDLNTGNRISNEDRIDMAAGLIGGLVGGGLVTKGFINGHEIAGNGWRIAPFGNRTGNKYGELPHYHRSCPNPNKPGESLPGQGIGRHRPWQSKSPDNSFFDRF